MRALRPLSLVAIAAGTAAPAIARGGHAHGHEPPGWTLDPWITVPLLVSALLFAVGWRRLLQRSDRGSSALRRRGLWFALGWVTLAGALVSPLHAAGERSFAAHMFEHELLMLVGAPFLVLSEPLVIMLWAFPSPTRRALGTFGASAPISAVWRALTAPVTATIVQAAALWLWHAPSLFDRALDNEGWHAVQHLSFLLSALFFWSAMIGHHGRRPRTAGARSVAALCLFATSIISGALGALMAFSQSPWYAGYARLGMAPFGLTPAEDQQLAGLIMWVPGGLVHAAVALVMVKTVLDPASWEGATVNAR
jgi:cytochrome c oxidase assembly factor CtaG